MRILCDDMLVLCHASDVPDGDARGFLPGPDAPRRIIVYRRGETYRAYLDSCPHYRAGTPMSWRADAYMNCDRTHLVCFAHGALFDLETGVCVAGPCKGRRLTAIALMLRDNGDLCVSDPALLC